jgi:4-O-beta-D-mannosyl-D-glucose phosphorylase
LKDYNRQVLALFEEHKKLTLKENQVDENDNGIFTRYKNPILTAAHVPIFWRYDLNPKTNPFLMERLLVNSVFNAGAIEFNGKMLLVARVEGADRKSFFAVAESNTGIDGFRFWQKPLEIPETEKPATNVYDMRLTKHEDGYIYGVFCVEHHDDNKPDDLSAAVAQCGIIRSKDMQHWERLADLKTNSTQQRNCVLHPEYVDGKYAFYTRPLTTFLGTNSGKGIGFGLTDSIENAEIIDEEIFDLNMYHTIKEGKNGQGPAPLKTKKGWLHLAHGVRNTAAGMRYVLYSFLTDLNRPTRILYQPGGHLLAPIGIERIGDVSNVLFSNGWIARKNSEVFIYYASSDTRLHVATTTVDRLLDYVINTPEDPLFSYNCVQQRKAVIENNFAIMKKLDIEY